MGKSLSVLMMVALSAHPVAGGQQLEVWPSVRTAAGFLAGKVATDLRDMRNLFEPRCIVRSRGRADTPLASDAVMFALAQVGFETTSLKTSSQATGKSHLPVLEVETQGHGEQHVLVLSLQDKQYRTTYLDKDWVDDPQGVMTRDGVLRVRVTSGRHPDQAVAREEAQRMLEAEILTSLVQRADHPVSGQQLAGRIPRLTALRAAHRDSFTAVVNRPYGTIFQEHLLFEIPEERIDQWLRALISERRFQRRLWLAGGTGTIVLWAAGFFVAIKLDHWTLGYRRSVVVCGVVLSLAVATLATWWLLL